MKTKRRSSRYGAGVLVYASGIALLAGGVAPASHAETIVFASPQMRAGETGRLAARVSRWETKSTRTQKGPPGFGPEFQFVSRRFDGTFGIDGVPQTVPEGEAFVALIKLTNAGKKDIKVATVSVTGDGISLSPVLLQKKIRPRTVAMVASFKVPPQSSAGSTFLVNVALSNGDRHQATLSFAKPS